MGYDRFPELLINEKTKLLNHVINSKAKLFYTHDPKFAVSNVSINEKNKFEAANCQELVQLHPKLNQGLS